MSRARRPKRQAVPSQPGQPAQAAGGFAWRAVVLVLIGALAYANGLSGPFVFDDRASVIDNHTIEDLGAVSEVFAPPRETPVAGRPLVNLTFALNYAVGGRNVAGYHVVNIAIHLLCGVVLFAIARRTFEWPAVRVWAGPAGVSLAFAIALIWLVHPLNSEVVDYVTQRTESLMALGLLLALYASARAWESPRGGWEAAAVLACAGGMLCKESMVTAPLLVVLYDRAFVVSSFREAFRTRARLYAGLAAGWIVLALVLASSPRGLSAGFFAHDAAPWNYLLNQARMILEYLRLSIWPTSLALYYGWPVPLTLADVWPHAVLVAALGLGAVAAWVRRPAVGFPGVWFFITLAPTSSLVPIATEVGAERRMYLPLMALVALAVVGARQLAIVLTRSPDRAGSGLRGRKATGLQGYRAAGLVGASARMPVVGAVALAIVGALGVAGTIARNREYRSSLTLAETTVARWPSPAGHSMLGTELAAAGRFDEAEAHLRAAAPDYPPARYYLGTVLARRGRHDEAIAQLRQFIDAQPPELDQVYLARVALADALLRTGQTAAAIDEYRRLIADRPADFDALAGLANALVREGRYDEAAARYQAYLATSPNDARAQGGLAIALSAQGRTEEALIAFRRAADLDAANPRAQQNLARALAGIGRVAEAEAPAARAVSLAPGEPSGHLLLGQILAALGRTDAARASLERALALDPNSPAREILRQLR